MAKRLVAEDFDRIKKCLNFIDKGLGRYKKVESFLGGKHSSSTIKLIDMSTTFEEYRETMKKLNTKYKKPSVNQENGLFNGVGHTEEQKDKKLPLNIDKLFLSDLNDNILKLTSIIQSMLQEMQELKREREGKQPWYKRI